MRLAVAVAALLGIFGCCPGPPAASAGATSYTVLGEVDAGQDSLEFYIHYTLDAAVLGFATADDTGRRRYCPMYPSTYRGIPSVDLEVHASDTGEEVWVRSSWTGYETLAHYRAGSDQCSTHYGDNALFAEPTPASLGGCSASLPSFDPERTTQIGTLGHRPDR